MGLCKCPKRKVTNLFCFEHRVNVCEHCLVANHAKCIVQSYLQWLQDSDYNPNCRLCNIPLASRETTRLVCYGEALAPRGDQASLRGQLGDWFPGPPQAAGQSLSLGLPQ
ncbi:ZFPL1 isoform 8 [Pan troglodytes]|uniref:Zinc finger protein-like 1 n=4 Tax=Catarrhini TaxID=9526 RepID=E9PMQ3_HUMAN|nr:zinc finger protein like 1 [Homo sapiens]KAI4072174.1 zinc finger protein like 1 [Homo sapiens]PNI93920.1 ZFPL1 isoform 8 [Pan troglodytes]